MIRINKMNLRLPAHLHHRAASIGRQVGQQLGDQLQGQSINIERLQIKGLSVGPHDSDQLIANAIVMGILNKTRGQS